MKKRNSFIQFYYLIFRLIFLISSFNWPYEVVILLSLIWKNDQMIRRIIKRKDKQQKRVNSKSKNSYTNHLNSSIIICIIVFLIII